MGVYTPAFAVRNASGTTKEYVLPLNNLAATAAPTVNDDSGDGYIPGSMWVDTTNDDTWFCQDNSLGTAVWEKVGATSGTVTSVSGSGGTTGLTLTGGPITSSGTLTLGGTLALANGGTGAALTDPNADRIMFWDDSAGVVTWLTVGTGLSISTTTISATGGTGDVVGPASATDNSLAIFDGTTGKLLKSDSDLVYNPGTMTLGVPSVETASVQLIDGSVSTYNLFLVALSTAAMTADRSLTFDVNNVNRLIFLSGNISFGGNVSTTGGDITFATVAGSGVTLPASGTLATLAGTETLTNKNIDAGQLTGTIAAARLPAASDTAIGALEIAVQSEMETGTSTTLAVTPGRQQYHPSASKAWVVFEADGTLAVLGSYNVTSVADNGTGDFTVTLDTDFSGTGYAAVGTASQSVDMTSNCIVVENTLGSSRTAGTFPLYTLASNGAVKDASFVSVAFFGDQ